ncbi:alpha-NAC related protein [Methanococcus vannielii SB]|jgi:nascent polypeptide-associated complex subunit alpha|uniref:Nascent polypeptide-associated complex protein n=1 Tax=Methanococcus vannielii (strain ATCC 35089 / DSM 1224 / JCM 13029 / OCM 148 / SB) TaxID=406327 RepID=NAC_METVS|nr:nascent polypeptide-associated complex protein [Methanococcus vannielii]A6URS6.1 RecName: Full=Nascent polypeptide-associated complex protein [Methanococcus vannielii SB]ABR55198.1 alpha-NAC related protein [Methanococcus vannielii SB]
MFPGGKMNPRMMKQMQKMMKDFGMDSEDLKAVKVTIELEDKIMVFDKPKVQVMDMMGTKTYTISGRSKNTSKTAEKIEDTEVKVEVTEEDIEMVATQCNVSKEEAKTALEDVNGDLAEAILKLGN